MRKFTNAFIAGSLITAGTIAYALSDGRMRRKVLKGSKKAARNAADTLDDIKSKIW